MTRHKYRRRGRITYVCVCRTIRIERRAIGDIRAVSRRRHEHRTRSYGFIRNVERRGMLGNGRNGFSKIKCFLERTWTWRSWIPDDRCSGRLVRRTDGESFGIIRCCRCTIYLRTYARRLGNANNTRCNGSRVWRAIVAWSDAQRFTCGSDDRRTRASVVDIAEND